MEDVTRMLAKMQKAISSLDGQQVPMSGLLDPPFMIEHTQFCSLDEMLQRSGLPHETEQEWVQLPEEQVDAFVSAHTEYATWTEMLQAAMQEWAARWIGL